MFLQQNTVRSPSRSVIHMDRNQVVQRGQSWGPHPSLGLGHRSCLATAGQTGNQMNDRIGTRQWKCLGLGCPRQEKGDPSLILLSLLCSNIIVFPRELQQALVPWQCTPCQQPRHSPEQLQSCNELVRFQLFRVRQRGPRVIPWQGHRRAWEKSNGTSETPATWSYMVARS